MKGRYKVSMTSALLVAAMICLVGVGFAISYTGTATTTTDDSSGEFITVSASNPDFKGGIFTVDTANDGTNVALNNLKQWDSVEDDSATAMSLSGKYFAYSAGAFSLAAVDSGYKAAVIGEITVTVTQSDDAQANKVTLTTSGAESGTANQYGMSLVYTIKVNDGTETVIADPNTAQTVALTSGTGTVVLTAYLVYSASVPVANMGSMAVYSLNDATVTFSAQAVYE